MIDSGGIERKREKLSKKIAIIGAGITGLSSAYFIKTRSNYRSNDI